MLKLILELDGMEWIDLSEDRDQWRALVNAGDEVREPWGRWSEKFWEPLI
jgi:hypothetical protein